jgi:hypothetical protein
MTIGIRHFRFTIKVADLLTTQQESAGILSTFIVR